MKIKFAEEGNRSPEYLESDWDQQISARLRVPFQKVTHRVFCACFFSLVLCNFTNKLFYGWCSSVSTACKLSMKFEPVKEKLNLISTLIQPITKHVQILNFMGSLHAVLSPSPSPSSLLPSPLPRMHIFPLRHTSDSLRIFPSPRPLIEVF